MNQEEFELYQTLIADVESAKEAAGNVREMSTLFPGNKRVLSELQQANQALFDFHMGEWNKIYRAED